MGLRTSPTSPTATGRPSPRRTHPGRGGEPLRHPDRGRRGGGTGPQTLTAPLPGKIADIAAKAGHIVELGDTIRVIMENDEPRAWAPGAVAEPRVGPGQTGNAGVLVAID